MSELKLQGKIIKIFDLTKVSDTFTKQEFVVETDEQYPQQVKFEAIQSRCDQLQHVKEGDEVICHFNVKGRPWENNQGETKYFNSLQAWRIEKATAAASNESVIEDMKAEEGTVDNFSDSLPF